jgi:hypothetical protein
MYCPAQVSAVPFFQSCRKGQLATLLPRLPKSPSKSNDFYEVSGGEISLLCRAHGFPTPGFS